MTTGKETLCLGSGDSKVPSVDTSEGPRGDVQPNGKEAGTTEGWPSQARIWISIRRWQGSALGLGVEVKCD